MRFLKKAASGLSLLCRHLEEPRLEAYVGKWRKTNTKEPARKMNGQHALNRAENGNNNKREPF